MAVSDYLKVEFCVMDLESRNKKEAIIQIAERLSGSGKLLDKDKFIKDVLEREVLGSTGIGNKVGIPHARTNAVKGIVIGFGMSKQGIEFNALDGEKVNLIFLMGTEPEELNQYLRILAEVSKLLMNSSFRLELLGAVSEKDVIKAIKKFERI